MLERVVAYFRKRMKDPVTWVAAFFVLPWVPAAILGWSPVLVVNGTFFVAALAEWGAMVAWWWKERSFRGEVLARLKPASDRWKPGSLMVVGALTLALEVWVDSVAPGFGGIWVTLFGVSSLVAGWYAWAKPIIVARPGLIVGASLVPWSGVRGVSRGGRLLRIDFEHAHHFYGVKLLVAAGDEDERILLDLVPGARSSEVSSRAVTGP